MASAADKNEDSLEYASFETVSNEELSHIKDMPLEESMAINDNEENSVVNIEDLACDAVDPDQITTAPVTSLARATKHIQWDISAGAMLQEADVYSLEAGETVTINCSYTPANASVDFGLHQTAISVMLTEPMGVSIKKLRSIPVAYIAWQFVIIPTRRSACLVMSTIKIFPTVRPDALMASQPGLRIRKTRSHKFLRQLTHLRFAHLGAVC